MRYCSLKINKRTTYLESGEILELPASQVPRPNITRSWDRYDFEFEGYNVGDSRRYFGNYMGVEVYINPVGSYIGAETSVAVQEPGLYGRSMLVQPNGAMHKLDNIPIQDGAEYYLTYLNEAPVYVTVIIYTWY